MLASVYKLRYSIVLPVCLALLILLATSSADVAAILYQRFTYCMEHLIPSLFACMMICEMLVSLGGLEQLQRLMCHIGINGALVGIYLFSQIGGYPIGVLLLRDMVNRERITVTQAQKYAAVCFGAGPSFLVGIAGVQLLGSAVTGWLLFLCCTIANTIVAVVWLRDAWRHTIALSDMPSTGFPSALVHSAQRTLESLWRITATVLLFGVICFVGEALGIVDVLKCAGACMEIPFAVTKAIFYTICDVTNIAALCNVGISYENLLIILSAAFSFGGLCVHCQCIALSGGWLSFRKLLAVRAMTAMLASVICCLALPLFPQPATLDVFSNQVVVSKTGSLLPAFLIFCTGFPIFLKKD